MPLKGWGPCFLAGYQLGTVLRSYRPPVILCCIWPIHNTVLFSLRITGDCLSLAFFRSEKALTVFQKVNWIKSSPPRTLCFDYLEVNCVDTIITSEKPSLHLCIECNAITEMTSMIPILHLHSKAKYYTEACTQGSENLKGHHIILLSHSLNLNCKERITFKPTLIKKGGKARKILE